MGASDWKCPEDRFPIMGPGHSGYGERQLTVPLAWVLEHERQAQSNHGQSIARLKERGGLSWCELSAVVDDRQHVRMNQDDAHERAMRSLCVWQDKLRRAEALSASKEAGEP